MDTKDTKPISWHPASTAADRTAKAAKGAKNIWSAIRQPSSYVLSVLGVLGGKQALRMTHAIDVSHVSKMCRRHRGEPL